jgi:hypothetical protein
VGAVALFLVIAELRDRRALGREPIPHRHRAGDRLEVEVAERTLEGLERDGEVGLDHQALFFQGFELAPASSGSFLSLGLSKMEWTPADI